VLYDCVRVWGSRVWQAILKSQQGLHPYKIQERRGEAATNSHAFFFSQTLHFRGLWSWLDVLAIFPSLLRMVVFVRKPMQWLDRLSHMRELYTWSSFSYAGNLFDDWWCIRYVAVCIEACKNALWQEALPTLLFFANWVWAQAEKNLDGCWMDFSIAHYPVSNQCQCIFFVSWCWPVYWHNLFQNLQQAHQSMTSSRSFSLKFVALLLWSVPTRVWAIVRF
jgi:hypothetical protein